MLLDSALIIVTRAAILIAGHQSGMRHA